MRPEEPALLSAAVLAALTLAAAPGAGPADDLLDAVLARHVRDGLVDYAALKTDVDFGRCVEELASAEPDALPTREERLARWINVYNALVLKGVIDHYPIRSVSDVGLLGKWTFFRGLEFSIGGRRLTLDRIEHGIIRPVFREPRVHFALVCASRGCPKLPSRAFRGGTLDADLEAAASRFINDPDKVRLDRERGVLHVSRLFEWYAGDFAAAGGSVPRYIARYLAGGLPDGVKLEYLDYSWALNDSGSTPSGSPPRP